MKQIVNSVFLFTKDLPAKSFIYIAFFLAITISFNYYIDLEDSHIDTAPNDFLRTVYYFILYAVSYFGTLFPLRYLSRNKTRIPDSKNFWIKSILFLLLLSFAAGFHSYADIVRELIEPENYQLIRKILSNTKRFLIYIIPLALMIRWLNPELKSFYGLTTKGFHFQPYLILMAFMIPLIIWASFQVDFIQQYPSFRAWKTGPAFNLSVWETQIIYEVFYLAGFVFVELMFRGVLVLGMKKNLGPDVILPMVVTYAFLHFGKPLGECIGSIFGGYILGIIAYNSKSIIGGCIIHGGVALLMDLTAMYQHFYNE